MQYKILEAEFSGRNLKLKKITLVSALTYIFIKMKSASRIFYGKCYCLQGDGLDECGAALNKWHELENNK